MLRIITLIFSFSKVFLYLRGINKLKYNVMKKNLKLVAFSAILLMLAGSFFSCEKAKEEWTVQLKLESLTDGGYLAIEDPKIKTLISKHGVIFHQSYPEFNPSVFLLYYTLTGNSDKENTIKDFLTTGIFDDMIRDECIHFACGVRFKLKLHADESYLATEDPEIQALVAKYGIGFRQTYPGSQTPELGLFYTLNNEYDKEVNMINVVRDFLATGKFEGEVYEYGEVHLN